MTDKELKKLSRAELLEMLLLQTQEVERLRAELEQLSGQLHKRNLELDAAGNIAEAALKVNGFFEAAQSAADQYLESIASMERKTREACELLEQQTKEKCDGFVRQAEQDAQAFWQQIREEIQDPYLEHERWLQINSALTGKLYEKIQF